MKSTTTMVCLLAFCGLTLTTAFGAATGGNCLKVAVSLSVSAAEKTTEVTLVRGWEQDLNEWSGETPEDSEYVKWYKVSLKKGQPYVFWTTDTSNENICLSVEPNYDLETCPYTSFDSLSIGENQYCYVTAGGWNMEDPSTCTFYVSLTGGDYYGGKTITLHYQQTDISSIMPNGTAENPEVLNIFPPGVITRTTPGKSGEYFFEVALKADVEYKFVRMVEDPPPYFWIEGYAVDESSQSYVCTKLQFIEKNMAGFTIRPNEDGNYIIYLSGEETRIRLWVGDSEINVETASVDGVRWSYFVRNEDAFVIDAVPASGILRIPSVLGGYPVKGIGRSAFCVCVGLTHVIMPNGVAVIGEEAFRGCSSLVSIDMPPSVTNIGHDAFAGCDAISSVTLPACVTQLSGVFPSYQSITNVVICEGTTHISDYTFDDCFALANVTIPDGVTSVGSMAFLNCRSLTSINMPPSVRSMGHGAFTGCSGITSVSIPNGVTSIGGRVFQNCSSLTSVGMPPSVTSIGDEAFSGCLALTGIDMPPSVASIGHDAFAGCDAISSVTLPACVTQLSGVFPSYQSITNVVICEGTTHISDYAFDDCFALANVTIPDGVTSIGSMAFLNCRSLTNIDMPPSVASIGHAAFAGCDAISSVTLPACVTQLSGVFPSYQSITNVVICEGTTCISYYEFGGCISLMSITVPESIMSIEEEAFRGCSSLVSIDIPDGVTCIETSTFSGCTHLADVTIPSSVTSIDSEAFYKCANLKNLNFAGDAPDMGINVFYGTPRSLVINVEPDALGWNDHTYMGEMPPWGLRKVNGLGTDSGDDPIPSDHEFKLTITNVVVHYVLNSVQPEIAVPISGDTGFVAVVTEVSNTGAVSVPSEWKDNYPTFESKFGTDFGKALMSQTGKKDSANNDMLVWQDFVAGTDPTKEDDVFTASITIVDGVPIISYTPELSDEQKALRTYKTFGKKQLQDKDWTDITDLDGELMKSYNFFKVTVEMK